jgi:ABC-type transporter Mla subunit MlaD
VSPGLHELYQRASDVGRGLDNATDETASASRDLYDLRDNVTRINDDLASAWATAASSSDTMYFAGSQVVTTNVGMYKMQVVADVLFGVPDQYA